MFSSIIRCALKRWAFVTCTFLFFISAIGNRQLYGGVTFYGTTGLTFIPTAEVLPPGSFVLSYFSNPDTKYDVNLIPFSVRWGFARTRPRIEILFTNTYLYANRQYGVDVKNRNIFFPLIPSVKYQVAAMSPSTNNTAMAFGVTTPYGAFYAYDKHLIWKPWHITFHSGIATKLTTYHVFTGATVYFGKEISEYNHRWPFKLVFEGSWGGSLSNLKEKEESFWAVTSVYQWTENLTLEVFLRFDGGYGNFSPERRMGIGLSYIRVQK